MSTALLHVPHLEEDIVPTPPLHVPKGVKPRDDIKAILEDQIVSTRRGGYQKFLAKWKNRPFSDCCWL
jgi:hypothetical protein